MSKMMNKMDMGKSSIKMGSSSTKMSSSSVSSVSSSKMYSNMSTMLNGDNVMSLPPMRGMEMPGFPSMPGMTIEDLSSTPTPSSAASPDTPYSVTSPGSSRTHTVGAANDYKSRSSTDPDTSVLLQHKTGSDYKLALNMQQFGADDITINLNGKELIIKAKNHGEQFQQKHIIPDHIDLDAMTSSFSSDGVLVIKAPKMK